MLETLRNAWKITDLRRKILYTLLLLLVFRIGSFIPSPFVDAEIIRKSVEGNPLLGLMDLFNGGSLSAFTLLAAGITPYITASIVIQLLTVAIPKLEALQKEGEEGRNKLNVITRYVAIILAFIQSTAIIWSLSVSANAVIHPSWYIFVFIGIVQAGGTAFTMWMGEHITQVGIGNGMSLLVFINIIARLPVVVFGGTGGEGASRFFSLLLIALLAVAVIVAVVFVDMGQRRFPVQYAKRMVGRKMYGGQSTHIPMKVNNSGVLPLIFALTLVQFPGMIIQMFWSTSKFALAYSRLMSTGTILNGVLTALFIVAFTYFYATVTFNPTDISKNLQQQGGFIPGIRPGKPTSDYLLRSSMRITLFNSIYLALLATLPMFVAHFTGQKSPFGATSILIAVSVALETSKQIEAQLLMRHYRGFLK